MLGVQAAAPDKCYHAAKIFIVAAMVFTDLRHAVACAFSGAAPIAAAVVLYICIYTNAQRGRGQQPHHVFVHAPVHGAAPMATAEGMFSMPPGAQQLRTSHRGRSKGSSWPWRYSQAMGHAFTRAPARGADPIAAAGGMASMLGAQAALTTRSMMR